MKYFHCLFLFFLSHFVFAQSKPIDSIVSGLQKDQLLFEKVFIHTNKTNYVKEDVIWFKAYVAKNDNKPSAHTSLLYVSLFSEAGELLKTKNVLIRNGVGKGEFLLSSDLPKGDYVIQANTNYMRNFGDKNNFITKITISGKALEIEKPKTPKYDIQVFPEGGHLLENIKNSIGIKALINGRGQDFTGEIRDSKETKIVDFKSEHLGMASLDFLYNGSETYSAFFKINDTIITVPIPKAKKRGLAIKVENLDNSFLEINLKTNKETLTISKPIYTLLFHQNNKLIDVIEVEVRDTSNIKLQINKKEFFKGVNTVTVFNEFGRPVLERKFFVNSASVNSEITLEHLNVIEDSTIYKLKLKSLKVKSNLSISVLARNTGYNSYSTIESAFLLRPYIKGYIERPASYFDKKIKNRERNIDLLLLTQGWTNYSVEDYINKLNPKYKHDFEVGFSLKGTVSPLKSNNLALLANNDQIVGRDFLNNKTNFNFENLLVYRNDSIKVSFLVGKDQNIIEKPTNIYFDSLEQKSFKMTYKFMDKFVYKPKGVSTKTISESEDYRFNSNGATGLEDVYLETKKKSEEHVKWREFVDKYRKYDQKIGFFDPIDIKETYINKDVYVLDYLRKEIDLRRGPNNRYISGTRTVGIALDGEGVLYSELRFMKMSDVEAVGRTFPSKQSLAIVLFSTPNYRKGIKELFKKHYFTSGYDRAKKYYKPKYFNAQKDLIEEIDWKPFVLTNNNGDATFKLINEETKNYLFSIQGFTENGDLINELKSFQELLVN